MEAALATFPQGKAWQSGENKAGPSQPFLTGRELSRTLEKVGKRFLYMTSLVFQSFWICRGIEVRGRMLITM